MIRQYLLLVGCLLVPLSGAATGTHSTAVSPGGTWRPVTIEDGCPTFSWAAIDGARGYELVVFDTQSGSDGEPVLRREFPSGASTWTPSTGQCLASGGTYAWAVKAIGDHRPNRWSSPLLFQVAGIPDRDDFEAAFAIVQSYLATGVEQAESFPAGSEGRVDGGAGDISGSFGSTVLPGGPVAAVGDEAALSVEGEVRTVDAIGQPRLWGTGRPGADIYLEEGSEPPALCSSGEIRYGLSAMVTAWTSAQSACPAGTWVCTLAERGTTVCDTLRDAGQGWTCAGIPIAFSSSDHYGWVADGQGSEGLYVFETSGGPFAQDPCSSLPVWCCRYD